MLCNNLHVAHMPYDVCVMHVADTKRSPHMFCYIIFSETVCAWKNLV